MNIKSTILLLSCFLMIMMSCKKNRHEEFGRELAKNFKSNKYKNFDTTAYFQVFKQQLAKEKDKIHNPIWMGKIYNDEIAGLTLIGEFLVDGQLDTLGYYLQRSIYHGLDPNYFHASEIDTLLKQVKNTKFKNVEESYPLLASLEILSADGLINYANILKYGAVNPKNIFSRYYDDVERPDLIEAKSSIEQLDLVKFIHDVQPKNGYYQRLQNVLINEDIKQPLSPEQKEKIYLSLERLRWPAKEYPAKYLLVNIPEFKLRMIENNTSDLEMKVCVGEAKNGEDNHETPILSGTIDRMQVNPVWNIPESIASTEILDHLKRDAYYLESNNMVAYKNGELVYSPSIDWNTVDVSEFSFKQNPGADNALGQIKFIFQNPYAIYLHDTPSQAAFKQSNRAVSHGCIRVEEPMKLASFLLKDKSEAERIRKETLAASQGAAVEARWVKVEEPVPVFIAYYTAWTNDSGKLITSNDVYNYDNMLKPRFSRYMTKLN